MTDKERILAADLMQLASEEFGDHGCNDLDDKLFEKWSKEEIQQLTKEYHDFNGDPEEYNPNHLYLPDFAVMAYLANKLRTGI